MGRIDPRGLILTFLVLTWSVRLGVFLELRILARKRDTRFDGIREKFWNYLKFWATQAMWVWLVSQSVLLVNTLSVEPLAPLSKKDFHGFLFWLVGFSLEWLADYQKSQFNRLYGKRRRSSSTTVDSETEATPGLKFIDSGLWRFCRHPNYFGEILLWFGAWYISRQGLSSLLALLSFASPIVTFILLVFVSGIPPSEKRDEKRFGKLPSYIQWKFVTSPLLPCFPSIYARIPLSLRKWLFLDSYSPTYRRVKRTLLTSDRYIPRSDVSSPSNRQR
jgi:steroid 5-alpha reductase family enzyme